MQVMIFEKNEIQKEERHDPCSLNNENICDNLFLNSNQTFRKPSTLIASITLVVIVLLMVFANLSQFQKEINHKNKHNDEKAKLESDPFQQAHPD